MNALKMARLIEQMSDVVPTQNGYKRFISWSCLLCDFGDEDHPWRGGWENCLRLMIEREGIDFGQVLARQRELIEKSTSRDSCRGMSGRELVEIVATLLDEQEATKS